ncbi:dihydrolipoyl dehydrogenase [Cohnella lubricantis]|uniref:Dihydrolipoyl dehydrogenase n=1 Tax=Cohnella lubricantis TaxID=2163172 RepID=A0A841T8N8_9BACL|nr:dihydrolipoyl dehydrogenase [Cohnella lubricantis]MBB6676375.1 dihydrolipoyl dehydrogenase [Cohnella lubricantis]MBP2117618.1 dihydrolipoamide dehydrogenase [Cohnella lubricantis]
MPIEVDVAVLGGGPGGYTAAVRAAQAGKTVALIEKDKLGGTCLHRGCIPSKSLLRSAEVFATLKEAHAYGIRVPEAGTAVEWDGVMSRKNAVVEQLHRGLQALMAQHKIQVVRGTGRIIGPSIFSPRSGAVAVELGDGESETIVPRHLIIATGSRPRRLEGLPYDDTHVATSDEALEWPSLPASAIIVGGGVIGVEWASMLSDFGSKVTLVETADRILPGEEKDVSSELAKLLKKRGVVIYTGAKLDTGSCAVSEGAVSVEIEAGGASVKLAAERMLVSIGRQGNVENMGFENTDVRAENGFVKVNPVTLQTGEPHIYAIGDCIGGVQLAHAAMHEAAVAVDHLLGRAGATARTADRDVPRCIYSRPEAASVGWNEENAKAAGFDVKTARIPMRIFGKALVYGEADGFAKVVADRATGDLLGVSLVGAHATDLIAEASLAKLLDAVPWEIGQAIHPHPTLSEALQEVMAALEGTAGHG